MPRTSRAASGYPLAGGDLAIATGSGANAGTVDQLWGLDRLASLNPATGTRAWYGYVTTQRTLSVKR